MSSAPFFEPAFLWALLACLLVLALHLLRRTKTVTMAFSSLRFFQERAVSAHHSRRFRQLLLLLVRLLLVIVVVLLFARPRWGDNLLEKLVDPRQELSCWVDATPSMGYLEQGVALGERASKLLDTLLALRPASALSNNYDVASGTYLPRKAGTPLLFQPHYQTPAWYGLIPGGRQPMLLVVSDFQESTTAALERAWESRTSGEKLTVICVPVTPPAPRDLSVLAVRLRNDREPMVTAALHAYGKQPTHTAIWATVDHVRCGSSKVTIAAGDSVEMHIPLARAVNDGWGTVTVSGEDPLQFNNRQVFVATRSRGVSVLVIGDAKQNYPIVAALAAADTVQWQSVVTRAAELVTYDEITAADLVIVNGYQQEPPVLRALQHAPAVKKQAIIIAAPETSEGESQVTVSGTGYPVKLAEQPLTVVLPDTLSLLWRGFPSLRATDVATYRYLQGLTGTVLLRLSNRVPLVTQTTDTLGRVWITVATPIGVTGSNNWCETGFYLPVLDRLARHAVAMLHEEQGEWIAGEGRANPWYGSSQPTLILDENSREVFRLQQQPTLVIENPGVYRIVPPGVAAYWQAVIPDPAESRLIYRLPKQKSTQKISVSIVRPKELLAYLRHNQSGMLITALTMLLLFLLIAEVALRDKPQKVFGNVCKPPFGDKK